jgi:Acetyltransferase (GNAT) domain
LSIEQKRLPSGENQQPYHYLFQDCFPETAGTSLQTPEHYHWKYGPDGKHAPPFEFAAYEASQILGYYAALPFAYSVAGKPMTAALVCDVMTHSRARGKGIFTAQGRFATEEMARNGIAFCTGYPIRSYVFPGHLKIGWRIAFPLPVYANLLDMRPVLASRHLSTLGNILQPLGSLWTQGCRLTRPKFREASCQEENPETFFSTGEFTSFYTTWARHSPSHLIRTAGFYRWRLSAPQSSYRVTALYIKCALAGVAITRNSILSGFPITNILDLMLLPECRQAAGTLHDALAQVSKRSGTAGLAVMSTRSDAARWNLCRNGYFKTSVQFKLILKWLAADPAPASFWDESAWHLTWLDTDNL